MYDRTSFNNGFVAGRQSALDEINKRIHYLEQSAKRHTTRIKNEMERTTSELRSIRDAVERLRPRGTMAELKRPVRSGWCDACGTPTEYACSDCAINGASVDLRRYVCPRTACRDKHEQLRQCNPAEPALNAPSPDAIAAETRRQCAVELDTILRNDDLDQPTQYAALRYLVSNWRVLFDKKPNL